MTKRSIGIIGGGVSGLTAAYELAKRGLDVTVYERASALGGFAAPVQLGDRWADRYYHFICGADRELVTLAEELGIGDHIHWRPARTAYFIDGHQYAFSTPLDLLRFAPLSLRGRLRFGMAVNRAKRDTDWASYDALTAVAWLRREMGDEAYEVVWQPLLETKFGSAADQVAAAWLRHRLWRVAQSRRSIWSPDEFGYFEGGTKTLIDALSGQVEALGGSIRLSAPVQGLLAGASGLSGLALPDDEVAHDAVISTVPLPGLVSILPASATAYRQALAEIEFIGIVCVLLRLSSRVQDNYWVNVSDRRVGFNGIIEYANLDPQAKLLYVPLYMPTTDARYSQSDAQLVSMVAEGLTVLNPAFDLASIREAVVSRAPYAQAICPPGFAARIPPAGSAIHGLYVTDSTQLYPSDRCISGMVGLARRTARVAAEG